MPPGQMAAAGGPMVPGQPPVGGAFSPPGARALGGLFSGLLGNRNRRKAEEFSPTPAPERLADVLEPRNRRLSRGLFVGVITGSLALGALAALAWRMLGK
jgi:hypothetical protein